MYTARLRRRHSRLEHGSARGGSTGRRIKSQVTRDVESMPANDGHDHPSQQKYGRQQQSTDNPQSSARNAGNGK
jgi:hypothetical protein